MTTIIMMFILPLGIVFYFFDKKTRKQNMTLFENYVLKIKASDLSPKDKLDKIDEMYYKNGYRRTFKSENTLIVEKKHFNLGVMFIFFGLFNYFGIFFFLFYYRFILKPEQLKTIL
jgi:hypothetical protein